MLARNSPCFGHRATRKEQEGITKLLTNLLQLSGKDRRLVRRRASAAPAQLLTHLRRACEPDYPISVATCTAPLHAWFPKVNLQPVSRKWQPCGLRFAYALLAALG